MSNSNKHLEVQQKEKKSPKLNKIRMIQESPADQDSFLEYWDLREQKLEKQREIAESHVFDGCVFYILGYVGRGDDSRFSMNKLIEKNGGKSVIMITSQVTHVVTRNLCQSKRKMLDQQIEKRKIAVVSPEYIHDCIKDQKLLDPTPYLTSKIKTTPITNYFQIK